MTKFFEKIMRSLFVEMIDYHTGKPIGDTIIVLIGVLGMAMTGAHNTTVAVVGGMMIIFALLSILVVRPTILRFLDKRAELSTGMRSTLWTATVISFIAVVHPERAAILPWLPLILIMAFIMASAISIAYFMSTQPGPKP